MPSYQRADMDEATDLIQNLKTQGKFKVIW